MNTPATENLIRVGNAVLSEQFIKQAEEFQENKNEMIDDTVMLLLKIIRLLAIYKDDFSDDHKEQAGNFIQSLGIHSDYLENFKQP